MIEPLRMAYFGLAFYPIMSNENSIVTGMFDDLTSNYYRHGRGSVLRYSSSLLLLDCLSPSSQSLSDTSRNGG
jgi:hypothetical protein